MQCYIMYMYSVFLFLFSVLEMLMCFVNFHKFYSCSLIMCKNRYDDAKVTMSKVFVKMHLVVNCGIKIFTNRNKKYKKVIAQRN